MTQIKSTTQTARGLLDRLLDRPEPVALVRSLSAGTVLRLIERVGVEDLGDVLALLSPEQLTHVFDQDLWISPRPGQDERFDPERFALWLSVLIEQSPALAAQKIMELDFELLALGLSKHIYVIDIEQLAQAMSRAARSDEADQLDKLLEDGLYHELEQYRVIAQNTRSFDTMLALLVELNTLDYAFLCELLERCCEISTEQIEDNGGLYEVLSAAEMNESDVAGEREQRREALGFVPPSSALAFLRLAQETSLAELVEATGQDAITRAHLRVADLTARQAKNGRKDEKGPSGAGLVAERWGMDDPGTFRLLAALEGLLAEPQATLPRLPRAAASAPSLLARALTGLCDRDPQRYERCVLEAAYLANVVLSGIGTADERLEPAVAAEVAFALCELGADELSLKAKRRPDAQLRVLLEQVASSGLIKLFQVGFHRLCATQPRARRHSAVLERLGRLLSAQGFISARSSAAATGHKSTENTVPR